MIPTIAFFNHAGGVGKTSLVYHLAWMYAELGHTVLAADLDPHANLSAVMVDQERLQALWDGDERGTLYAAINPLMRGLGDIAAPHRERIGDKLELLVGDPEILRFEDELSDQWARCMAGQERAFRVVTAFHRCIQAAASSAGADIVLIDLGSYAGAINRAALVASQYIVIPIAPDLFSLQGLKSLGPRVMQWRDEWRDRLSHNTVDALGLTDHVMRHAGYVVQQYSVHMGRQTQTAERWMSRIPKVYATHVGGEPTDAEHPSKDPRCLGLLKRYWSLMSMAHEARKPIFHLKPADGALGAHAAAVHGARADFKHVAERIAQATWQSRQPL